MEKLYFETTDQILESLYDRVIEPVEAKEQLLLLFGVSKSAFLDCNGDELKAGDKAIMTLKGLGDGQVEIVDHENQLQIFDKQMGYYPLIRALNRRDMIIERIS